MPKFKKRYVLGVGSPCPITIEKEEEAMALVLNGEVNYVKLNVPKELYHEKAPYYSLILERV